MKILCRKSNGKSHHKHLTMKTKSVCYHSRVLSVEIFIFAQSALVLLIQTLLVKKPLFQWIPYAKSWFTWSLYKVVWHVDSQVKKPDCLLTSCPLDSMYLAGLTSGQWPPCSGNNAQNHQFQFFSRRYVTVGDVDCRVSWDSKTGGEAGKLASAHRWLDYKHSAVVLLMYRWLWTRSHLLCAWFLLSLLAQECVSLAIGCRSLMPHILILGIVLQEWNL